MKKYIVIVSMIAISGCDLHGWFPGWDDNPKSSTTQPTRGCNKDLTVHYKNNCSKNLIMYYLELNPGVMAICESLNNLGSMDINGTKTVTIHKGKVGYFVFAFDNEGKCSSEHRQGFAWVNCEQSTSGEATFNVCN